MGARAVPPTFPRTPRSTPRPPSTLRELMAPRIIGQEIASAQDSWIVLPSSRATSSPGPPRDHVVGAGRQAARAAPAPRTRRLPRSCRRGGGLRVQDSSISYGEDPGGHRRGLPRIKLKFRPGWDLHMVEAVRSTFPISPSTSTATQPTRRRIPSSFGSSIDTHLRHVEQPLADDG